ncbi:MAG: hypothetical protein ACTHJS_10235 [Xanthobacteraceae bacterium]
MSSFRLICIAALTAAMVLSVVHAAAAQSAKNQAGTAYLAGLRPPHEHPQASHGKTARSDSAHKPTTKSAQQTVKRQPAVAAKSKVHRRSVRLAEKINSRVAWPSVEPSAADQTATSETVLQFATEDATSAATTPPRTTSPPVAAPHSAMPASAASATKTAPPVNVAATDRHDSPDPIAADKAQDATGVVQAQRLDAPAPRPMRVIAPALSETPAVASTPGDQSPSRSPSSAAQILVTLAGAIAACIVGFMIFGFGSARIRQI